VQNLSFSGFLSGRHPKLHAFAKQLMGVAHRMYACTQACVIEVCFTAKLGS